MGITGNLRTMELAELLQWLSQGQKTGTLVIDDAEVEKRIFFRDGKIVSSASSDPKEHLGHFLVSHGHITEDQLSEAVRRQEREKTLLGKILVRMGLISGDTLDHMLRLKSEETIYSLFRWKEGEFGFLDDELPDYEMVPIALDVTGLILEASRRLDEWRRIRAIIPSVRAVPVRVDERLLDDEELTDGQRQILAAINDDRTIEEIALETHASEYFVCETIYPRVRGGEVKIVRPREPARESSSDGISLIDAGALVQRAQVHLKNGEYKATLRHLRAARSLEPENREIEKEAERTEEVIRRNLEKDGIVPTAVPRLERSLDELTSLDVSPQAGFVLSRIDGGYDIASIVKISPMSELEAMFVFWELQKDGHIRLE